jgi:two-component system repressor protein LuxO
MDPLLLTSAGMTGGKILILEDDPHIARVYGTALSEDGNSVTVCGTFEQAREHLRREQPDAVVTDVRVGEYNGLQLALLFRRSSPDGRVVVITGFDDAVLRRDVGEIQGKFLLKPVRIAQLKNAVYAGDPAPAVVPHQA